MEIAGGSSALELCFGFFSFKHWQKNVVQEFHNVMIEVHRKKGNC